MALDSSIGNLNDMYFSWDEGLKANKPASLARGRFYYATDEEKIYYGKADFTEGVISINQAPGGGGGGEGDMTKLVYDPNNTGRVLLADGVSDGVNQATAAQIKAAVLAEHAKQHAVNSSADHTGVPGAVENNFASFDANGLPKDSAKKASDFAPVIHTQASSTITDFTEAAQDAALGILGNSSTANIIYDDNTNEASVQVVPNSNTQKVEVAKAGSVAGTRKEINFIEGANITINLADNAGGDRVDVTIAAAGTGGDMAKTTYDTNNDGIVNAAALLTDGAASVTPGQAGMAVGMAHSKQHNFNSTADHVGIPGATAGNFAAFDANGMPVSDTGYGPASFMPAGGNISITASQVTDFNEAAQDAVGNSIGNSTTISKNYDDAANQLTLNVNGNTSIQKVEVARAGSLISTRKRINFTQGANVTLTVTDDSANDKVDVQIAATSGGGGSNYEVYTDAYGVVKNGTTDDSSALQTAINNIGSIACDLVFTKGTYAITNVSLTFPSNINPVFEKGAILQIGSGRTITMNMPTAGVYQIFSGSGYASVTLRNATGRGGVLPNWWYSGSGNMQPALNIAHNVASAINTFVFLPAGSYSVTSTVTCKAHMKGEGAEKSVLQSGITNNTAVLQYNNIDRFLLEDFKINGSGNNWHGVQTVNSCNRYFMKNIYVAGANIAFDLNGWIADLQNLWVYGCTTGLQGIILNATRINFNCEASTNGIILKRSSGTLIDNGCIESCTHGIIIQDGDSVDMTQGITIQNTYHEGNTYNVEVGITAGIYNQCHNILIQGGKFTNGQILFDNCVGGGIRDAFCYCRVNLTANAKNVQVDTTPEFLWNGNQTRPYLSIEAPMVGALQNLVPDPYFTLGRIAGYDSVQFTRAKAGQETSSTYNGGAIRVDADNGQTNCYVDLKFHSEARDFTAYRTIRVGGWVWCPTRSNAAIRPDIDLVWYNGSTEAQTTQLGTFEMTEGRWNFVCKDIAITNPGSSGYVSIRLYANHSAQASSNDYAIFSGLFVGEAVGKFSDIANGKWLRHGMAGALVGHNIITYSDASITNGIMTFRKGDKIINNNASAGGTGEWICTDNGTTGTLTAVTGSITSGTNSLSLNSASRVGPGMYIEIAGVSGVKKIIALSGTTATLDSNSDSTVSGAAVAYHNPTWTSLTLS